MQKLTVGGDLVAMAEAFVGDHRRNPSDDSNRMRLNAFLDSLKSQGGEMSRYNEEYWEAAFRALGLNPEYDSDYLDCVASYGMTDDQAFE